MFDFYDGVVGIVTERFQFVLESPLYEVYLVDEGYTIIASLSEELRQSSIPIYLDYLNTDNIVGDIVLIKNGDIVLIKIKTSDYEPSDYELYPYPSLISISFLK